MHDYDIVDLLVGIIAVLGRCKPKDLRAFGRCPSLCKLRDTLLYLARKRTQLSFPELGHYFGGRHHTTIMSGVRNEERRLARNLRLPTGQTIAEWHARILQQLDEAIAVLLAEKAACMPAPADVEAAVETPSTPTTENDSDA